MQRSSAVMSVCLWGLSACSATWVPTGMSNGDAQSAIILLARYAREQNRDWGPRDVSCLYLAPVGQEGPEPSQQVLGAFATDSIPLWSGVECERQSREASQTGVQLYFFYDIFITVSAFERVQASQWQVPITWWVKDPFCPVYGADAFLSSGGGPWMLDSVVVYTGCL